MKYQDHHKQQTCYLVMCQQDVDHQCRIMTFTPLVIILIVSTSVIIVFIKKIASMCMHT